MYPAGGAALSNGGGGCAPPGASRCKVAPPQPSSLGRWEVRAQEVTGLGWGFGREEDCLPFFVICPRAAHVVRGHILKNLLWAASIAASEGSRPALAPL